MSAGLIYHICRRDEWRLAETAGRHGGSSQDAADGFIHFSTAAQIAASAAKHRPGQRDLVLVAADPGRLASDELRWETSRGGELFPHLYGALPLDAVVSVRDLPLGDDGRHRFPVPF